MFEQCNFELESPEILNQKVICSHRRSIPSNSILIDCGRLSNPHIKQRVTIAIANSWYLLTNSLHIKTHFTTLTVHVCVYLCPPLVILLQVKWLLNHVCCWIFDLSSCIIDRQFGNG